MSIITINDLHKVYDGTQVEVHAVNGVTLNIEEGEFSALVGPSGSGKTTLMNMLGGLDRPTSGQVLINGTDLSQLKDSELIDFRLHHIGFVFQSYNLIPVLTALENVEFIMHLQGVPSAERHARARELLEAVGLGDRLNSRPGQLSGGQQQRVAVARALASKPRYVLADEPTANLDSHSTENLLDIMEELNHKENITFVFSTHDARVVKKAHRVIVLEDGKVISDEVREKVGASNSNE
ncbi:ABC transporter ATP-binding protein [Prolixibacter denitrificans]|uniref:ABC transporter ATP-binding protein n=1 Tax=Prolixibacter denitrificans TaxID=1541063 RepID=A0A2P8CD42_9BACT|nr:ABC transporter ATP-binding protein [Prolixibacter denitrificans]PSK82849.1 putative ABC transport system ATP-binding protein [Prolixibacter denitrificans]GET21336.1 ABC transporter ATP-binding protein [Prolixibacter denitrificans]